MTGQITRRLALAAPLALAACASAPQGFLIPTYREAEGGSLVDMLVITTRQPSAQPGVVFGGERDLGYSISEIKVSIPPSEHRQVGLVQWPKANKPPDPETQFTTVSITPSDPEHTLDWFKRVAGDKRRLLIFVHGYNTRFESAVYRMAQIAQDSGAEAAPVLFTWPSRGRMFDYVYDKDSALFSRDALELLINRAVEQPEVHDITILAHSMGTMLTVETLRQVAIRHDGFIPEKVRNVVLASPDIDVQLFQRQMEVVKKPRPHLTIFTSSDDKALAISRLISGKMSRLGSIDPSKEPYRTRIEEAGDVTVIDLTAYKAGDSLNHGKFAESPEIVQLIGQRLVNGQHLANER